MGWRILLLSEQEPGRVGRRRDDGHLGRRPRGAAPEAPAPRRGEAIPPRRGGQPLAARLAPGGRAAREVAAPRGMVGEATGARGVLYARACRSSGGPAPGGGRRERAHLSSIHPAGRAPGRAAGTPQAPRDRKRDLLSRAAAPAALLQPSGLPARPAARGGAGIGRGACPPGPPPAAPQPAPLPIH